MFNNWTNEEYNSSLRLGTYEEFKKKAVEVIFENKEAEIKNSDDFCLKSDNVSKNIFKEFKKYLVWTIYLY